LNGATWSGDITSIAAAGVVTIAPDTFSINFKTESAHLERGVKTARGAPRSCEPAQPPCKPCRPEGSNKG
jgi:hypothetical protein